MKDIIIHMGLHRTATTTLQNRLQEARQDLLADGTALLLRRDMAANRALDMRAWHRPVRLGALFRREKRFARAAGKLPGNRVLISEENLVGTMPGVKGAVADDGIAFYLHFNSFIKSLQRLNKYMMVHPRLVVRRQDQYLESAYAFRVTRGLKLDFPAFLKSLNPCNFDWNPLADALQAFGENSKTAVLEHWQKNGSVTDQAMAFVGLTPTGTPEAYGNRRPDHEGLQLLLALNRLNLLMTLEERKQHVFPALHQADSETLSAVVERLPLVQNQKALMQQSLNAPPVAVGFSARDRSAFMGRLADCNRLFLSRTDIEADQDTWAL